MAALQLLVSRSLSAALAKEVSKCANRIGASHLGNSLWTLLSGSTTPFQRRIKQALHHRVVLTL